LADWLKSVLASDTAFIICSLAALTATIVVAVGLILEYERHELIGLSKKQIGGFLVVAGVTLEAVFGLGAFVSATIRESRLETELIAVEERTHLLVSDKDRIIDKLTPFVGQKIAIFLSPGDQEQIEEETEFGVVIMGLVTAAGWLNPMGNKYSAAARDLTIDDDAGPYFDNGLTVEIDDSATARAKDAAEALRSAMWNAHLRIGNGTDMLLSRPPIPSTDKNTILLFVFPRPLF
jgi:hypothetical protein